ncbi:unnamed protein product [Peronospora destructor]|uniref:Uncharacterized protein n=1 Tax=Peronospora destructor TaxID=86335 RepID=A0AAV0V459_9STRA|nr:unnamed protein product [Peronospora destructor]
MVLPLFIIGTVSVGTVTGYGMYQAGAMLALPSSVGEAPPKSASSLATGGISAVATYSAQGRRGVSATFCASLGPLVAPRVAMFSTSVALKGFVSTKVELFREHNNR